MNQSAEDEGSVIMPADIEEVLQVTVSDEFARKISDAQLAYVPVDGEERARCIAYIRKIIDDPQRVEPKNDNVFLRFKQEFIKPASSNFEAKMLGIIKEWFLEKYFTGLDAVRELGRQAVVRGIVPDVAGKRVGMYTTGAIGSANKEVFAPFLERIIARRPLVCIHIEPIAEFLDEENELDALCSGLLRGFLPHLRALEERGIIKIIRAQRTFFGTFLGEPYSVIVWIPQE